LPREAGSGEHPAGSAIILAVLIDFLAVSGTNLADTSVFLPKWMLFLPKLRLILPINKIIQDTPVQNDHPVPDSCTNPTIKPR
jgi:hypothetical protein